MVFLIPEGRHPHLKRRRAGQTGAPQHIAGSIGVKAADGLACGTEPLCNAPDQAGGMGTLPFLRFRGGKVNDIQLVEPPGLDPDVAVGARGCHCDQVQGHRCCQTIAVLVVGVVASQLCTTGCRIQMHLPSRTKIQLKLLQRCTIPPALPLELCRCGAVQCTQEPVPPACRDLLPELVACRHRRSSLPVRTRIL